MKALYPKNTLQSEHKRFTLRKILSIVFYLEILELLFGDQLQIRKSKVQSPTLIYPRNMKIIFNAIRMEPRASLGSSRTAMWSP